ncbi:MAG: transcriptional regulator [Hahellaceae bacterium]|jgi:hypothetical protein|nr:transcriptional regulator [Hahellaceae bacterium]
MSHVARKLLTIVTESALEKILPEDFKKLGARGFTITEARGQGSRGMRSGTWDENGNIRIEILCDSVTADAIAHHLQTRYYDDYAMVVFISDVMVLRPDKF